MRKLAYSTGAKEKIYAFSKALPTRSFDYDVDTETLSIEIFDLETSHSCPSSYNTSCYSSDKNFSTISAITYNAEYSKGFDCSVAKNEGLNFMLGQKRSSIGEFTLKFDDGA